MGTKRIRGIRAVALCAGFLSLAASGPCVDEEAIRELEARRAALLADRLPKEELWTLIEQRGRALEQTAELRRLLQGIEARTAASETRAVELEQALDQVRVRREAISSEIGEVTAERKRVEAELASVEGELRSLKDRLGSGGGAP